MLAAMNPIRNRDLIIGLIISCFILATMYAYLVMSCNFPVREIFNLVLCVVSGVALMVIYPWKIES
jgi:ABC-type Fe3+ transport system permease subunit